VADMNISISATIQGLITALNDASSQVKKTTDSIQGAFDGIGGAVGKLMAPMAALAAIVKGGSMFKEAVAHAADWSTTSLKLAKVLGTTTQEASVLKVALHGLGIETDVYTGAANFLARQVSTGGAGFKKMGIDIRDANHQLKPMTVIMQESIEKLLTLKAGIDRNAAGIALFGRGWQASSALLKLTSEKMAEARKEAEELHLIVGPEGAKKAYEYKEQMRKLGLIHDSLQIQIGTALMPVLLNLGKWLGESGPAKASLLADALRTILTVFIAFKADVEILTTVIAAVLDNIVTSIMTVAKSMKLIIEGEYKQALAVFHSGARQVEGSWTAAAQNITETWKNAQKQVGEVWTPPDTKTKKTEGAGASFAPEDDKEQVKIWKEQLEQIKALQSNWFTWSAQRELEFWTAKKATAKQGTDAYRFALEQENKARKEVLKEGQAIENISIKMEESARLAALAREGDAVKQAASLNLITLMDEVNRIEAIERKKFEIKKAYIAAQMALEGVTEQQRAAFQAAQLQAELELTGKIQELHQRAESYRQKTLDDAAAGVEKFMSPFVSGFTSGLQRMLEGTLSFKDAIKGIAGMLRGALAQAISGMVADWMSGLIKMLARWVVMKTQELIFHTATEEAKATTTVAAATTSATANAVAGGVAAGASAAETPGIGWMIALPAAALVVGGLLAMMGGIKSAAGGYDIPSGLNPMIQAHADEMVLPAKYANVIRSMADGGQEQGGAQSRPVAIHVNGVLDGGHLMRTLNSSEGQAAILKAVREAMRNGRMS
jgi:hypothetical protein